MKTNPKIISAILILGLISVFQYGCKKDEKDDPKPIIVTTTITPTTIASGSTAQYTITITNLGEAIVITRVHAKDEFVSGWAKGQPAQETDLPTTNISFDANETIIVFDQVIGPLTNTGPNDVGIKNTVTAYYDGGSVSDVISYKLTNAKKKSGEIGANPLASESIVKKIK